MIRRATSRTSRTIPPMTPPIVESEILTPVAAIGSGTQIRLELKTAKH